MFTKDFQEGVLFAVAMIIETHDQPVIAANVLRAAAMENADCSLMDDMEKENIKAVNLERGINLNGL